MNRLASIRPEFVEFVPSELEEGVLYISISYNTAVHRCACGCGSKIVTPISPAGWQLIYDGESVSLEPSVGNWSYPCQSHYWIIQDRIEWAPQWTREQVEAGRQRDRLARRRYLATTSGESSTGTTDRRPSLWTRLKQRAERLFR